MYETMEELGRRNELNTVFGQTRLYERAGSGWPAA